MQYKVWGDHKSHILHVGDHMIPIPYKVWGTISHIRHEDTSHVGDHMYIWGAHMILVPYMLRGEPYIHVRDHMIPILYKVWGP